MSEGVGLSRHLVAVLSGWVLLAGCDSQERKIKARANGIRAHVARVHGNFASEADKICAEMPQAKTTIVPPLEKSCSDGCECASDADRGPASATRYDCSQWEAPEWRLLKFAGRYALDGKVSPRVYVHHQAQWQRTEKGCRLDLTVYGDLDGDGVYSTYATMVETEPDGPIGHMPDVSLLWE